jgi:hypothetical protein
MPNQFAQARWVKIAVVVSALALTTGAALSTSRRDTEATSALATSASGSGDSFVVDAPEVSASTAKPTNSAPIAAITAPSPGATVQGTVAMAATASDPDGILKIRFWVDGLYLGYDSSAPFARTWDSRLSVNGLRTIKIQALDTTGASTIVTEQVTVANTDSTPPTLTIAAPAADAAVGGDVQIEALATDNTAVQKVRFWVDGTYLGYDQSTPYSRTWSTSQFANGSHVLKAEALDNLNNSTLATRTVTVANGTPSATATTTPTPTPLPTRTATATPGASDLPVPWIGVNNWALASASDVNGLCGDNSQLSLHSKLTTLKGAGVDVIRFAAYQAYAIDGSHQRNWLAFDRVFADAAAHGIHLIPILGNNWADCDYWGVYPGSTARDAGTPVECGGTGGWYDASGAPGPTGNYKAPYAGYITGYRQWVQDFVSRYKTQSSIITWELLNEPWDSCARSFFIDVTNLIRSLDPVTPIGLGGNPNGWSPDDQKLPNVNVLTAHDYSQPTNPLPSVVASGLTLANALGKPFYVGEAGLDCNNDHIGCPSNGLVPPYPKGSCDESARVPYLSAKISAAFAAGAKGYILWAYSQTQVLGSCSHDFGPQSPVLSIPGGY